MESFIKFQKLIQKEVKLQIKYKDESNFMVLLYFFVHYFNPHFMKYYSTTIGSHIYFPSRDFVKQDEQRAMRILAHELVHVLDAQKYGLLSFMLAYLFPQVLVIGILSFPWLGLYALFFLIFLLPLPAPFRFYFESRAYTIDKLLKPHTNVEDYVDCFTSWDYYKMYPFPEKVIEKLNYWVALVELEGDEVLGKVLELHEEAKKSDV